MNVRFVVSIALPLTLLLLLPVGLEARPRKPPTSPSDQPPTQPPPTAKPPTKTAPDKPAEEPVFEDDTPESSGSDAEPSAKNAVPSDDAQQAVTKLVKEVYGDDYQNAKTPENKRALARKLLQKAIETDKDLPGRYILLRLSRDIATQAADGTTAFRAIAEMAKTFKIDGLDMKLATLRKLSAVVHTAKQHEAIAKKAMELADKAVGKENFSVAKQLNELAVQEARNTKDRELVAHATEQTSSLEEIVASFDAAQAAAKVLDQKPDDPAANLAVGKYECFAKADWGRGLPMLALGSDAGLRAIAAKELEGAASTDAQVAMGDAWWDLAEKEAGTVKKLCQGRAAYWYAKAQPELSGLTKDKVAKRLDTISSETRPADPTQPTSGKWLDVMPRIKIARDRVAGEWTMTAGRITTGGDGHAPRIMLPVVIAGSYDLSLEFTRLRCHDGIVIILPAGDSGCALFIGGYGGGVSGFDLIDGKAADKNGTTRRNDTFVVGRRSSLLVKVRLQDEAVRMDVLLDSRPFIQWTGHPSSLSLHKTWKLPQSKCPGLASRNDPVSFQSVKVRAVSGKLLRSGQVEELKPSGTKKTPKVKQPKNHVPEKDDLKL